MIGEVIAEFKGTQTRSRVLADGKLKGSSTGSGTVMGKEAMELDTAVLTPMPDGTLMIEGNGMIMTVEGETVMVKNEGLGWLAGKGFKSSGRGALFFMTSSPKLASLNKIVGVWEREADEKGDFTIKIWAWK
jgi:hypothetical protein